MLPGGGSPGREAWQWLEQPRPPREGQKEGRGQAGGPRLRVHSLGFWAAGPCGGGLRARAAVLLRARLCTLLGILRVTRPHPEGILCVLQQNQTPFLINDPLPRRMVFFPIPDPRESFAEQVSGVKLLDSGWGVGVWCKQGSLR